MELLVVVVAMGVLALMALPKMTPVRERQALRGARGELVATIEAARAAALQRGRRAQVIVAPAPALNPNQVSATMNDGTGFVVVATTDLRQEYGVTLSVRGAAESGPITFDGRGLANPRLNAVGARYVLTSARGQRDSVCVSNLGLLLPPGCLP
jgi:Tfp pilus assembly protein FimT